MAARTIRGGPPGSPDHAVRCGLPGRRDLAHRRRPHGALAGRASEPRREYRSFDDINDGFDDALGRDFSQWIDAGTALSVTV